MAAWPSIPTILNYDRLAVGRRVADIDAELWLDAEALAAQQQPVGSRLGGRHLVRPERHL